jgi:hypothetical protein
MTDYWLIEFDEARAGRGKDSNQEPELFLMIDFFA